METGFIILLVSVFLGAAGTTFIPWLIPIIYASIGALILSGTDPLILSIAVGLGAVSGTSFLWYMDIKYGKHIDKYLQLPKKWKDKLQSKKKEGSRISKWLESLHHKLTIVHKKSVLFWIVTLTTYSAIPDIIVIKYTRKKMPFTLFLVATIIGKIFVYLPIIYGVEFINIIIG